MELLEEGKIKPTVKASEFKISDNDLEILINMCKDNRIVDIINSNKGVNHQNAFLANLLKFYIRGENGDFKPLVLSDEEFNKLKNVNTMYRATSIGSHDLNRLLNSPMELRGGSNGSGIYFAEGEDGKVADYCISHLRDKNVVESHGNIYMAALNPEASIVDKFALHYVSGQLIKSINDGCYPDGTKLEVGCNKQTLTDLLSFDTTIVALLMGVNAIYVPFRKFIDKNRALGHYILLDKKAIAVSSNLDSQNASVDIANLKSNPENEIKKISAKLIR